MTKKMKTLLVDGDVLLYEVVHQTLRVHEVGDGKYQTIGDAAEALSRFCGRVNDLKLSADCEDVVLCFSHHSPTFRHTQVDPDYKKKRSQESVDRKRPIHFFPTEDRIKAWAEDAPGVSFVTEAGLEADDLIGLFATNGTPCVICTIDKDLQTIPGTHMHLRTQEKSVINELQADAMFYTQALSGDTVDDIPGCKGIGKVRAERLVEKAIEDAEPGESPDFWSVVTATYEKAGMGEEDAIRNARLVRILRDGEYDWDSKEVKLWEPK